MELRDNPPSEPQFNKLVRTIAANEPRVTKFKINWDSSTAAATGSQAEVSQACGSVDGMNNASNGQDSNMMEVGSVNAASSIANSNFQASNQNPNQISFNSKLENKENISIQQPKSLIDSKLTESNQGIENSYDGIMN